MRGLLFSIACLLISTTLSSQCISGNCVNGEGHFRLSNQSYYQGHFKNGKFDGKGQLKYDNNDLYVGLFKNGSKHGLGKYTFADGSKFIGDFKHGKRHGKGKMNFANQEVYKGEWWNGDMHGQGLYLFADGSRYEGQFVNGQLEGTGTMTNQYGHQSAGKWIDNVQQNEHSSPPVSTRYKNCTTSYCDSEEGAFYYEDGSVYFGQFIKGHPEGKGRCEYANGSIYEGGWKNHAPHGDGVMHMQEGNSFAGTFDNGKMINRTYQDVSKAEKPTSKKQQPKAKEFEEGTKIYAVVIGVASYNHLQSLKYTDDDAYQLYAFLKSPSGGAIPDDQIKILIDDGATKKKIEKTIDEVFAQADADDVVLLYLSGHGLDGAYVPYDFDGSKNLISYNTILDKLSKTKAKNKLLITDACHSGSMYASKGSLDLQLDHYYGELSDANPGVAMISSSKQDEVSLEYSGMRQGVFSHFLIRGLKGEANQDGDHLVDLSELFNYVYKNVQHYTNQSQTPSIGGDYDPKMPVAMIYEY